MATLEELKVVINAELAPFQRKMKQLEGSMNQATRGVKENVNSIKNAFSGLAKLAVVGLLFQQLYRLGKYSVQTALEVQASINQISRIMGESTQSFLKWAENNALAFNMSRGEAIKYGATYGNILAGFIQNQEKLAAYTTKLLETSSIIAQGTGRTMTDVMERIRSGLLGNTEAIEDLGVMVNVSMIESTEAFKKFANGQSWQQLDFQTQQQIRLMAILEQATKRYGETLEDTVNTRISTFKALMKDTALNIGNAFLPIINAVMPILNAFASALRWATAKLAEFVQLLFDKKVSSNDGVAGAVGNVTKGLQGAGGAAGDLADNLDDASGGADNLADNVGNAGKAAKKAVKELRGLMGFDEINLLNKKADDSDSDVGSGGKGKGGKGKGKGGKDILPDIDITDRGTQYNTMFDGLLEKLKPLKDFLVHLADLFKLGWKLTFREEGLDRIKEALKGIKESFEIIFSDGLVARTAGIFLEKLAFALGQVAGAIANVALGIGVLIFESIDKSLKETRLDIKSWLMRSFLEMGDIVGSIGNIAAKLSDIFYDTLTSKPSTDIGANIISTLTYAFMGIEDIWLKLVRDVFRGIEQVIGDNKDKFTQVFTGILDAVSPVIETLKDFVKDGFSIFNKVYDEHIKPFIDSFNGGISKITSIFLEMWNNHVNPTLKTLGEKFKSTYQNFIKPTLVSIGNLIGTVIDVLKVVLEKYIVPVISFLAKNVLPVVMPIIEQIGRSIMALFSVVSSIFKLIIDVITGFIKIVLGIFTGDWSKIWEGVKDIFKGAWDFIKGIFSAVGEEIGALIQTGFEFVKNIIVGIWDGIVLYFEIAYNNIIGVWQLIVSFFQGLWDGIVSIFSIVGQWFSDRFKEAWDFIVAIFQGIGNWFSDRWTDVKNILSPVANWFKEQWQKAWDNIDNIFKGIGRWFTERWNDVKTALSKVAEWFGTTFSQAYDAVKRAFSSIGTFFSGVWGTVKGIFVRAGQMVGNAVGGAFRGAVNAVLGTIENIVNGFIRMINGVIGLINKLPGVNLGTIGYVSLPRLARGGIVDSPTIAMIGEAGKEAVVPLENTGFLQTMGRVVSNAVAEVIGNGQQASSLPGGDIVIQLGGTEYARFTIDEINKEQERVGQTLIKI